jgi:glyoxylase-like metal-dependent hydrolase (beta-lactamase superfamily II)
MFGRYEFSGIEVVPPTTTFDSELTLTVGDTEVRLYEVGPAHTRGDVIVHVPDRGVVFTGDILFNGGHPIVWAGPVSNWVAACELILDLTPDVVVPGHGALTDTSAVADQRDYFGFLEREVAPRAAAGMAPLDAARDIDLGPYAELTEGERFVVNVAAVYRDLGHEMSADAAWALDQMAAYGTP